MQGTDVTERNENVDISEKKQQEMLRLIHSC